MSYTSEVLPPNPIVGTFDPDTVTITVVATHLTVNLSTWTFQNWDPDAPDIVVIDGSGRTEALTITGSDQNDVIIGGTGNDNIDGEAGSDTADYSYRTGAVVVTLNGATSATVSVGGFIEDTIVNIENIVGGSAGDTLTGDSADNTFTGREGADILDGGAGSDTADYSEKTGAVVVTLNGATSATVTVGASAEDSIVNIENIVGGSAGDTLTGDAADNTFTGREGADILDGGAGSDTADYGDKTGAVVVTLNGATSATVTVGVSAEDSIVNIENIVGGSGDDELTGDDEDNIFVGGGGADTLLVGDGDDTIHYVAGDGADTLLDGGGGTGDTLAVTGTIGADTIRVVVASGVITRLSSNAAPIGGSDNVANIELATLNLGEGGTDTLDYSGTAAAVTVNLATGLASGFTSAVSGVENVTGGEVGDSLTGDVNANALVGGLGDDTIHYVAGDGADTLLDGGGGTGDTLAVTGTIGADTIRVVVASGVITRLSSNAAPIGGSDNVANIELATLNLGEGGTDTLDYSGTAAAVTVNLATGLASGFTSAVSGVENVTGGDGDDTLTGSGGVNLLDGGAGDDTIHYTVGGGIDTIDGGDETAGDTLAVSGTLGDDVIDVVFAGVVITTIEGMTPQDIEFFTLDALGHGAFGDTLSYAGTIVAVTVNLSGPQTATGFLSVSGVENVTGGEGGDTLTGSGGANVLNGGNGGDTLSGAGGIDTINGGGGNDTIVGFVDADKVNGGTDFDTLTLAATSAALNAAANDRLVSVEAVSAALAAAGVVINLGAQSDGFTITGSIHGDTITGSSAADTINAGDGDDTILGFVGGDKVDGGADGDTLKLTATSSALNAAADGALLNVEAVSAALAAAGVTIGLGAQSDGFTVTGSAQSDTVTGSSGADTINAGAGADTVAGSTGDDTLDGGDGNDSLAGGSGVDVVRGRSGDDTIHAAGLDGNDVYDGGTDTDTVDYSAITGGMKIDLTPSDRSGQAIVGEPNTVAALLLAGGFASATTQVGLANGASTSVDVLVSIENAIGGAGGDTILGSAAANLLEGGGGSDKIWARGDDDTVRGGTGNDVLVGGFGGTSGKPSGNDVLFGDSGNDQLFGEDGDDDLWGGNGSDQYAAGAGRDVLHFEGDGEGDTAWGGSERDTFTFHPGFGVDRIKDMHATGTESDRIDLSDFSVSFKDLKLVQAGQNVEISGLGGGSKIILEVVNAGAITAADFVLARVDRSKGTKKSDVINGGSENDRIKGLGGKDKLNGKGGNDALDGGGGADKLYGGSGDDSLNGGAGADRLNGGIGADTLTGGSKRDSFVFDFPSDGIDTITDFSSGSDRIEISAAGFGGGLVANSAATLVGLAEVAGYVDGGSKGIFLFDNGGADLGTIYWDANGGSSADAIAFARINGGSLLESDFRIF